MFCSSCKSIKSINEFIGFEVKDTLKQFRTYNNYHNRLYINMKKKQNENKEIDRPVKQYKNVKKKVERN